MSDLSHYIGGDLALSATGDLALSSGTLEGQQRILRRLLTNAGDYLWQLDYGAGVSQEIGKTLDAGRLRALIREQLFNEAIVSHQPDPVILISPIDHGISVRIQYVDAEVQQPVNLAFNINR